MCALLALFGTVQLILMLCWRWRGGPEEDAGPRPSTQAGGPATSV
jgi:hypothetical protein